MSFLSPPLQVEPSRDSAQDGGDTAEIGSDKAWPQPGSLHVKVPTSLKSQRWTITCSLAPKRDEQKRGHNNVSHNLSHTNSNLCSWTRGGCGLDLAHPVLWRRKSLGCNPTSSPGAGMKGFAGSQDLCESSPDPTRNTKLKRTKT